MAAHSIGHFPPAPSRTGGGDNVHPQSALPCGFRPLLAKVSRWTLTVPELRIGLGSSQLSALPTDHRPLPYFAWPRTLPKHRTAPKRPVRYRSGGLSRAPDRTYYSTEEIQGDVMLTTEQIDRLLSQGANVLSGDGEKIGSIGQVFVDNEAGQPSWVTVRTGLFGMSESFVPLEGARLEGNDIVVPYNKNQVKDAPRIDADRPLEPAEEDRLYQHYRMDSGRTYTDADTADAASTTRQDTTGTDRAETRDITDTDRAETRDATGTAGYGTATPTTDPATPPTTRQDTTGTDRAETPDATDTNRAQTRDATDTNRAQTRDA